MSLKAKVEAIIYAAEEPVTLEQISVLLKDTVLADLASARENAAIEQADFAAEALAIEFQATAEATESVALPELAHELPAVLCPEPGPLMPDHTGAEEPAPAEANLAAEENLAEESAAAETPEPAVHAAEAEIAAPSETEVPAPDAAGIPPELAPNAASPNAASPEAAPVTGESEEARSAGEPEAAPAAEESATTAEPEPAASASLTPPETTSRKRLPRKTEAEIAEDKAVRARIREVLIELITDYSSEDRGMEIRQVAGGFRMATKPEHHDVVRAFAKSLKPPIRLSLAALETLAVIAYKQPVTGPEIADIRGVESASVLGTLLDRKLITTAGRKQVIGRPMQYKTSKDFLLRFGLNDVNELPSMEEFSQLASDGTVEIAPEQQESLFEPARPAPSEASPDSAGGEAESEAGGPFKPAFGLSGEAASEQPENNPPSPTPEQNSGPENLEADGQGSQNPEPPPPDAPTEAADSQPHSGAESGNQPEAGRPIGQ